MGGLKVSTISNILDPMGWHVEKVLQKKGYSDKEVKKKNWARNYIGDPGGIYGEDPKDPEIPKPKPTPLSAAALKTEEETKDKLNRYPILKTKKKKPIMTVSDDETLG